MKLLSVACKLVVTFSLIFSVVTAHAEDTQSLQPFLQDYKTCLNHATTTIGMRECADHLYKKSDAALNHYYRQTMSLLSKDNQQRLRKAQTLWLKYQKADCEYQAGLYSGGTLAVQTLDACVAESTFERANNLASYYQAVNQR